ncbi:hypothetical protein MPER_07185, partial [Moniliophthora perniciosa FA553]
NKVGKLKIDEYVTHHRKFAEINEGFHDMHLIQRAEIAFVASLICKIYRTIILRPLRDDE